MAHPIEITLGTGNKVSVNYQSQEVNVSVTYRLDREDTDVMALTRILASEVKAAHQIAWEQVRGETENQAQTSTAPPEPLKVEAELAQVEAVEEGGNTASPLPQTPLSGGQWNAIEALLVQAGWSQSQVEEHLLDQFGKSEIYELSGVQAAQLLLELQRAARLQTQARSQERRTAMTHQNGHQ
jgi:hypothetical protein